MARYGCRVFSAPHVLTGPQALLLTAVAAACGAFLAARLERWRSRSARAAAAVAGALLASTLAAAPTTTWNIVTDARAAHRLSTAAAERRGAEENGVDTSLTDRALAIIPEGQTYSLVVSDRVDLARASVFELWSLSALLPRIAITDPASAGWIVSWGIPPDALGVRVVDLHVIRARRRSDPPLYVARVTR